MPTYAYACTACEHRFEIVQSFSDDSLTACPECEGRLRKLFNAVGVVFKGSGFYRNDSRNESRNGRVSDSGKAAAGRKDSAGSPVPSSGSGSSSSDSSSSSTSSTSGSSTSGSSTDSSSSSGATKKATKAAPKSSSQSRGSAA